MDQLFRPPSGVAARHFDLVIFDLDGTLVDSAPDIVGALDATLIEAGFPTHPFATSKGFVGDGAAKLVERAAPAGLDAPAREKLLERFMVHYGDHLCKGTRLYDGVAESLSALSALGARLAVLTNKPARLARELLAMLGVVTHFERIVGDGDGFPRKPHPAAARALLAETRSTERRLLIVGDGVPDAALARNLGCAGAAVAWGYNDPQALLAAGAAFIVHHPLDVVAAVARGQPRPR